MTRAEAKQVEEIQTQPKRKRGRPRKIRPEAPQTVTQPTEIKKEPTNVTNPAA